MKRRIIIQPHARTLYYCIKCNKRINKSEYLKNSRVCDGCSEQKQIGEFK